MRSKDRQLLSDIHSSLDTLHRVYSKDSFIEPIQAIEYLRVNEPVLNRSKSKVNGLLYRIGLGNKTLKKDALSLISEYESLRDNWRQHNYDLAYSLAPRIGEAINPVEGRNLDRQQLSSIAMDVYNRLVIAGAGSGKTTTIVGLVKYLISQSIDPGRILVLSYTNNAVNELGSRIQKETGRKIQISTFHSLAMSIIRETNGSAPSVDDSSIQSFVEGAVKEYLSDPDSEYARAFNSYVISYLGRMDSYSAYSDLARFKDENPFITLAGYEVKSNGEADIANYLFMNSVLSRYEEEYKFDTSDKGHGRYRPDFHISGTDVYIEYFGIDAKGNVSKSLSSKDPEASKKYNESIKWKRETHQKNNTVMIELTYQDRLDGVLLNKLRDALIRNGIRLEPRDLLMEAEMKYGSASKIINLMVSDISSAITIIRESGDPYERAFPEGSTSEEKKELIALDSVLRPVYDRYVEHLRGARKIDFSGMIHQAIGVLQSGRYYHDYDYVIVDEYQDISSPRFKLLKVMRETHQFKLFCVGDDWQSIYRFNGSDVDYIINFEKYWGPSGICRIERTYRFSDPLMTRSSDFICTNEMQIRKSLRGPEGRTFLSIIDEKNHNDSVAAIKEKMKTFPESSSVLFLGRYRHDIAKLDFQFDWKPIAGEQYYKVIDDDRPDLDIRFMTIHGSKGLQADYVIVLNNQKGEYGFPSLRKECIVLSKHLSSPNENLQEERRLMYVAMTRSRKGTYLLTSKKHESLFILELQCHRAEVQKTNVNAKKESVRDPLVCPRCGGRLVLRRGPYGEFYGCSNYSRIKCEYKRKIKS